MWINPKKKTPETGQSTVIRVTTEETEALEVATYDGSSSTLNEPITAVAAGNGLDPADELLRNTGTMSNCRNCGAPHDGKRCEYCGTRYYTPVETVKKVFSLPKPARSSPSPVMKWVIIIVVILCAGGVAYYFVRRRRR